MTIDQISRRNAETLEQIVRQQNEKIEAQTIRVNLLERTLGTAINKIEQLERMITFQKATSVGHGPSVR